MRSSVNTRIAPFIMVDCTKPTSPRCDATAPLGRPVVPLVNKMTAGSSSASGHVDVVEGGSGPRGQEIGPVVLDHQAWGSGLA